VLRYKNGSIYEGEWAKGMKCGIGKMTYASGNYYEGQWANNKRNGHGVMNWLTTEEKYEGNWVDNFQSGFGAHIWLDGTTDNKLLRNRYVGYWKLGQRHGKGVFYYSNGSKYEGDWIENFKHGTGLFTFEDGTTYEGPFENDRMTERKVEFGSHAELIEDKPKKSKSKEKVDGDSKSKSTAKDAKSKTAKKSETDVKPVNSLSMAASNKLAAAQRAKKEVEANPFIKLIDVSDLMVHENN
jgi:hypothetical protein